MNFIPVTVIVTLAILLLFLLPVQDMGASSIDSFESQAYPVPLTPYPPPVKNGVNLYLPSVQVDLSPSLAPEP